MRERMIVVALMATALVMPIIFMPLVALAQVASDAIPDTSLIVTAVHAGQWPMVVALCIAIMVSLARSLIRSFPAGWVSWVTLAATILGSGSTAIVHAVQANQTWWGGLLSGIVQGAAVGLPAFFLYRQAHKEEPPAPKGGAK